MDEKEREINRRVQMETLARVTAEQQREELKAQRSAAYTEAIRKICDVFLDVPVLDAPLQRSAHHGMVLDNAVGAEAAGDFEGIVSPDNV